ncbi:tRNA-t(6)A37 methylthiotransferase [Clostridiaceae bacterium JG1575]|nr:tRNA-t(6)A37 methylthiotransferase [Clostridiaceae bacterium JG1575]
MKVAFETLGCRVNHYDTEAMRELFLRDGYEIVPFDEAADVYVINTCTVTNMGDKKSRQMIQRARRMNKEAVVCVVGCYAQIAGEELARTLPVDVVAGSRNKSSIVSFANRARATGEQVIEISEVLRNHELEALNIQDFQNKSRAFLKIQDGCNRFCTYCMIPYARGGIASKPSAQVLAEVNRLVACGFSEIILSGIHIASYGLDFPKNGSGQDLFLSKEEIKGAQEKAAQKALRNDPYDFLDLLEDLDAVPGLSRIRIGSIEPMFFRGDRLQRLARLKKLCPHFHLSLQSGSNGVLKRMQRRYTREEYRDAVLRLREALPSVNLTTDVIAGFPGETEEEHEETMDFLREIKLTKTHVFPYSPRSGTPAAAMPDQVPSSIKEERKKQLLALSDWHEAAYLKSLVGRTDVLLVEQSTKGESLGFITPYVEVRIAGNYPAGSLLKVQVLEALQHHCRGEVIPSTHELIEQHP